MEEIVEIEQIEAQEPIAKPQNSYIKAAKIIAIVCFALVFSLIIVAFVVDIVTFADVFFAFITGILGATVMFVIGFFLMMVSCLLIFGIYLLEEYGFWPIEWAIKAYNESMAEATITVEQILIFRIVRIVLLVLCVLIIASCIVSLILKKKAKKAGYVGKTAMITAFDIVAIIFAIFGILVAIGMLAISFII